VCGRSLTSRSLQQVGNDVEVPEYFSHCDLSTNFVKKR
jgi:hypothetical protein